MSLADELRAAKALIDTPEKWIKGEYARNGCFCALGAAFEAAGWEGWKLGSDIEGALDAELPDGFDSVPQFNDHPATTHADIMSLFDRAIAAAEGRS